MSPKSETLRGLFAPSPNCNDIPTVNVCSHEVPLPAYWRITELLHDGVSKQQIVRLIVSESGINTRRSVEEVVAAIADNQRLMVEHASKKNDEAAGESSSKANRASNRLNTLLLSKNPKKRFSVYSRRASRLDVHRELEPEDAESQSMLEGFKAQGEAAAQRSVGASAPERDAQ